MSRPCMTQRMETASLRALFLRMFSELCPELLDRLQSIAEALPAAVLEHPDAPEALARELAPWGSECNIEAPWFLEHAAVLVLRWRQNPSIPFFSIWCAGPTLTGYIPAWPKLEITWDPSIFGSSGQTVTPPTVATVGEAVAGDARVVFQEQMPERRAVWVTGTRRQARDAIARAVRNYLDRVETLAAEAGFQAPAERTGGGNADLPERVRWLIRRVVRGESWRSIGRSAGLHWTTVWRAALKLAKLLPIEA